MAEKIYVVYTETENVTRDTMTKHTGGYFLGKEDAYDAIQKVADEIEKHLSDRKDQFDYVRREPLKEGNDWGWRFIFKYKKVDRPAKNSKDGKSGRYPWNANDIFEWRVFCLEEDLNKVSIFGKEIGI